MSRAFALVTIFDLPSWAVLSSIVRQDNGISLGHLHECFIEFLRLVSYRYLPEIQMSLLDDRPSGKPLEIRQRQSIPYQNRNKKSRDLCLYLESTVDVESTP